MGVSAMIVLRRALYIILRAAIPCLHRAFLR
jgi:hypothetical protein